MLGIVAEVITAALLTIREERNEYKTNPLNQPISTVEAIAEVDIAETDTNALQPDFACLTDSHLSLMGSNIYQDCYFSLIPRSLPLKFIHRRFSDYKVDYTGFAFDFMENPVLPFEPDKISTVIQPTTMTLGDALQKVKALQMYFNFIPKNEHILGRDVTLKINGRIMMFKIAEQNTDTNLSTWNPIAPGIFLYATNSIN